MANKHVKLEDETKILLYKVKGRLQELHPNERIFDDTALRMALNKYWGYLNGGKKRTDTRGTSRADS